MSLQFILGNSGSGKSTFLYQKVISESIKNPDKNYIIIVPEQFTMQTQKELVMLHPARCIMNIDVLSFDRLAYRVFDELGTKTLTVLEETGKNLVLRKVAEDKKGELTVLKGNMTKKGYISEMKSLISELTQYNITPEIFEEMSQCKNMSPAFSYKANDILTMYQGFIDYIDGTYITTEEVLQLLIQVVGESNIVSKATMVFDGFTGFTPIQSKLIRQLLVLCEKILVTVTIDPTEDYLKMPQETELFAMSKKMIASLLVTAKETGVNVLEPVKMTMKGEIRFEKDGQLLHLEQNLFRKHTRPYQGDKKEISIASLSTPRAEAAYVAARIRQDIKEKKYHYNEIAVVCADMETSRHILPEIFSSYDIPYFIDAKTDIVFHPFIELIQGALEIIKEQFSYESVSRFLRSGLHDLTVEEVDILDNYLYCAGIRGKKKYMAEFTVMPYGYQEEQLQEINVIRQKLVKPFIPFVEQTAGKSHTVKEISQALYEFILYYNLEEVLLKESKEKESKGDMVKAKGYEQIYAMVMNLLDKMVLLLGDETMDVGEYSKILDAGFETISIGIIPQSQDCVVIGDIERTRLHHIKSVYLIGANDGAIPKSLGHGGILSQMERERLKEASYELAPTDREKAFMQKFYLYLMMTKPSKHLTITYSRVDKDGKGVRRSYIIGTILKMFPKIQIEEIEQDGIEHNLVTEKTTRNVLIELLLEYISKEDMSKEKKEWLASLLTWYENHPEYDLRQVMEGAFYYHKPEHINKSAMNQLLGDTISGSVTRLEQYARCAYAYFLRYGLKLSERKEYEMEAVDYGSLYHEALDCYSKLLKQRQESWFTITEDKSKEYLKEAVQMAYTSMHKADLTEDARAAFAMEKVNRTLQRSVWALTKQVRSGKFEPSAFEVTFKEVDALDALRFELSDEEQLQLNGKIDRLDIYEDDTTVYVKIIDYKSGKKDFDMLHMYHGLQIQLVLYMGAVVEGLSHKYPQKEVEEGGMFYYCIENPLVEGAPGMSEDKLSDAILTELKPKGIVNSKKEVIDALDTGLTGTSLVIPVGVTKSGDLAKKSKVASKEEFTIMEEYVKEQVIEIAKKIQEGEIDCKPYRLAKEKGCDYCPFHGVCGFDGKLNGYAYRKLENINSEELLEKMKKGGNADGNEMDEGTATGH